MIVVIDVQRSSMSTFIEYDELNLINLHFHASSSPVVTYIA